MLSPWKAHSWRRGAIGNVLGSGQGTVCSDWAFRCQNPSHLGDRRGLEAQSWAAHARKWVQGQTPPPLPAVSQMTGTAETWPRGAGRQDSGDQATGPERSPLRPLGGLVAPDRQAGGPWAGTDSGPEEVRPPALPSPSWAPGTLTFTPGKDGGPPSGSICPDGADGGAPQHVTP